MEKKKIALIVDADNWAYANIAKNIKKNIEQFYDIKIIPSHYFEDQIGKVLVLAQDFDLIHFFWRGILLKLDYEEFNNYVESLGLSLEVFKKRFISNKIITTAVYDHLYIDDINLCNTKNILSKCHNYYVSSKKLKKIYNELNIKKKPSCVITDGVDLEEFFPMNLERFNFLEKRKIVVGWVGNSAWQNNLEDIKGVNTIIKPAIDELVKEGYNIEPYFADKQERMIPHSEMVNYYSKIDIYVCASKSEGTPNPVLESMACGVPIISTNVGIVSEAFGKKQKEFILEERSKECLKEKIKYLLNNLDQFNELSIENQKSIEGWTWKKISYKMKKFFDMTFEENK